MARGDDEETIRGDDEERETIEATCVQAQIRVEEEEPPDSSDTDE